MPALKAGARHRGPCRQRHRGVPVECGAALTEPASPLRSAETGARSATAWLPKTFTVLRGYTAGQLVADLPAGLVVGIVALPLAIAFAIASGVPPDRGLITAIVAGFLISALGGSRVQIGGPTGAFVVIVYGIVQKYGSTDFSSRR